MLDYPSKSNHPDITVRSDFQRAAEILKEDPLGSGAKDILLKNTIKGCSDSMVLLGDILIDGDEEEKKKALELFIDAATMGNDSGMRNIGYCLAIGLGCERDKKQAAEWYIKSGNAGNAKAQCNIGVMYDFGNGVPEDPAEAARWFKMSAEGGYSRGMTNLGVMYLEGRGVDMNPEEAKKLFEKSNSPRALYRLARMYLDGTGIEKDTDTGMTYLLRSAEAMNSKAMYCLAKIKEENDFDAAIDLYRKAANKRNKDAISRLEELHIPLKNN